MARTIDNQFEDDVEEVEDDNNDTDANEDEDTDEDEDENDDSASSKTPKENRLKRANDEAKRRRLQVKEVRRQGAINTEAALALAEAGVPAPKLRRAVRVLGRDGLTVGNDGTVTGLAEAIESLKADVPELFSSGQTTDTDASVNPLTLPSGTPSRHNRRRTGQESQATVDKKLLDKYPSLRDARPGRRGR